MKMLNKVMAMVVVICFGLSNISFAFDANSFKLSPPSSFSDMKGPEFKEAAQIQLYVRAILEDVKEVDRDLLRQLGTYQFTEQTVFTKKISGTIYFSEPMTYELKGHKVLAEDGAYIIKARTATNKIYLCLITKAKDSRGYDVLVTPERIVAEALQKGDVTLTSASVSDRDKAIVNLYTEHEVSTENNVAIDDWIRKRMERGEYAIPDTHAYNTLYKNGKFYDSGKYLDGALKRVEKYLKALGLQNDTISRMVASITEKPFVIIPYDGVGKLPTISVEMKAMGIIATSKAWVTGHSSEFATYMFMYRYTYDRIVISGDEPDEIIGENIAETIMHEIGARCGLKVRRDPRTLRVMNVLDKYYASYVKAGRPAKLNIPKSVYDELKGLSPVNLFELELRNDYAAGVGDTRKKIFKSALLFPVMAMLGASGCSTIIDLSVDNDIVSDHVDARRLSSITSSVKNEKGAGRISTLISRLAYPDRTVQAYAVDELVELGAPAVEPLMQVLNVGPFKTMQDNEVARAKAEYALLRITDPNAIPVFVKGLSSSNRSVREISAASLNKLGWKPRTTRESVYYLIASGQKDKDQLVQLGKPAGEVLLELVSGQVPDERKEQGIVRNAATRALPLHTPEPELIPESDIRNRWIPSIKALGELGYSEAVPILTGLLGYPEKFHEEIEGWVSADGKGYSGHGITVLSTWEDKYSSLSRAAKEALVKIGAPAISGLIKGISSENPNTRYRIAEALSDIGDARAIAVLQGLLRDSNEKVREAAKEAIEKIERAQRTAPSSQPAAKPGVMPLEGPEGMINEVKPAAEKPVVRPANENQAQQISDLIAKRNWDELVKIGAPAVERLIQALGDADPNVCFSAAKALGRIRDPRAIQALGNATQAGDWDARDAAIEALGDIGGIEAAETLIKKNTLRYQPLYGSSANRADTAVSALTRIGEPAVLLLVEALTNSSNYELHGVAAALGRIGDKRAVDPLIQILNNKDVGRPQGDTPAKVSVAQALGKLKDARAVDTLIRTLLTDKDAVVRHCAAVALSEIGDERVVDALIKALDDEEFVHQEAAAVLDGFKWKPANQVQQISYLTAKHDWDALVKIGAPAVDHLLKGLGGDNRNIRESAAKTLGEMKDLRAVEPLIKALNDSDCNGYHNVRISAANSLGTLKDPRAVEPLIKLLKNDKNSDVREAAADALGWIGNPRAIEPLIQALSEDGLLVCPHIARALARIGESALEPLIKALSVGNPDGRRYAAEALGLMKNQKVIEPLVKALNDPSARENEPSVRYEAAKALDELKWKPTNIREEVSYELAKENWENLVKIGEPAVEPLINALGEKNEYVRQYAASALGEIKDPRAIKALTEMLKDDKEDVRKSAKEAIEKIEKAQQENDKEQKPKEEPKKSSMLNAPAAPQDIKAAKAQMGTAIPHLNDMQYGQMWRVEKITDVLWDASIGAIPTAAAKGELAKLAPEVGITVQERESVYDTWLKLAGIAVIGLGMRSDQKYPQPSDGDIRAIAAKIKDLQIEVFVPKSQLPNDMTAEFRRTLESIFGDRLRPYQDVEDLATMIKDPEKTIVMTVDLTKGQIDSLEKMKADLGRTRFMNFEKMDTDKMTRSETENYFAEVLGILLVTRAITAEESRDKTSRMYQMLAHLLENHAPDMKEIDNYIQTVADNSIDPIAKLRYVLKAILKAVPIAVYKLMKPAVEVLWSA